MAQQNAGERRRPSVDRSTRELKSFGRELIHPPSTERFQKWIAAGADRTSFFTDTLWGSIRWRKSIGRSLGPTLASGFKIEHWCQYLNWKVGPDGVPINISKWVELPTPSSWDLAEEGGEYRVNYVSHIVRGFPNVVRIAFAADQPWDTPLAVRIRSTHRRIIAPDPFIVTEAKFVVLEDARVEEVPLRLF
jgi:hypothetical protein